MSETPSPAPVSGDVVVHVFGRTDIGRIRDHNEDSFLVADLSSANASLQPEVRTHVVGPRGTLLMVADGLGGAAAGEIASDLAINTVYEEIRDRWVNGERKDPMGFALALKAAAEAANAKIYNYAIEHPEHRGLGTTATIVGVLGDTAYVAQVGDSRAYVVRDGEAQQITKDQSLMQRLVEAGELTQEEADRSERRNIILQALGPEPTVRIDLTHQKLRQNDVLVLCTDGLSGLVKKEEIAGVVDTTPDLVEACKQLIDHANENGGPDNITVIVARLEGEGLQAVELEDHVGHAVYALPSGTPLGGVPREEAPTAPTFRRRSPAPLPSSARTPEEGTPSAVPAGVVPMEERRRQVVTAIIAAIALLAVFLLARTLSGPGAVPLPVPPPAGPPAPAADPPDTTAQHPAP